MTENERIDTGAKIMGKGTAKRNAVLLKSLRNYLVANVCALLPMLWVGLGWMPDQVKISWRGEDETPVAIMCDGLVLQGEDHGRWAEGRVWRYYLREGMEWKELAFRLPEGKGAESVGRIELQKWKLFKWGKAGSGLTPVQEMENGWKFEDPRFERFGFASWKIGAGLVLLEFLLLGLSGMFAIRHQEEPRKKLLPSVFGVAFALALLMQVALPIQVYVANQSAFPCTPKELGLTVAMRFAVAWGLGGLMLGLLARCFGRWVLTLVLAFAMCVDLESSVLAIGMPQLNGNWHYFENTTRTVWDTAIWGAIFASMCGMHRILKHHIGKVALGFSMLVITALLVDVHPEPKTDTSKWIIDEFCPKSGIVQSLSYAKERNVFVFVIDSLECGQAHAIMEDPEVGPRLREQFRGFTEYTNNIGTGDYTLVALANLLTGKYPDSADNIVDYHDSLFTSDSVLKDYLENEDCAIYFMVEDAKSYTNRRKELTIDEKAESIMRRRSRDGFGWTMPEINCFRWLPFGVKLRYLRLWSLLAPIGRDEYIREWKLYPRLARAQVNPEEKRVFLFVHTEGVHVPVSCNRHGEQLPSEDNSDAGCVEMGFFIMEQLGGLFDSYRQKGIYDDALILVLADHGHHESLGRFEAAGDGELSGLARPFLWVKPAGGSGAFKTDGTPTSHANVAGLLREALVRDLGEADVRELLHSEHRLFRKIYAFDYMKEDWIVGPDGAVEEHSTGFLDGLGEKGWQPVELGYRYSLSFENRADYAGTIHSKHLLGRGGNLSWWSYQPEVELSFRVPDQKRRYSMRLEFGMWRREEGSEEGLGIVFRQIGGAPVRWIRGSARSEEGEILLHELIPDETGVIRIAAERESGLMSFVDFNHLQIDMEP